MGMLVSFILKMMIKGGKKVSNELFETSKDPKTTQENVFLKIISQEKDTEFGKKYNFESIKSIKDFQEKIPLTDYDFYQPYIQRMMDGGENILTSKEIVHYNLTSGTLGAPKNIPVSEDHVTLFSKYYSKYFNYIAAKTIGTKWTKEKGLSLSEGTYTLLPNGVSVGCASSLHTARMEKTCPNMPFDSMDLMYTSPKEARKPSKLGNYSKYLHALFALKEKNITYGNVTFSSVLLELLHYIENNWQMLCNNIESGKIDESIEMPIEERLSVEKKLKKNPKRANELRSIFENHLDDQFVKLIWPKLELFICVAGAGFQTYTNKIIERYIGPQIHFLYLGLSSSEGLYSVPLQLDSPDSVFIPEGVFMEFIPVENGVRDLSGGLKCLWELELGKTYELVITNLSGLYRYQLKDTIRVTGFYNNTPTMQFESRSGFAINMVAEKTSEVALFQTVKKSCEELGLEIYDYCVCPYNDENGSRYVFMYEVEKFPKGISRDKIRNCIEKHICKLNPEYEFLFQRGTLMPLEIRFLQKETFILYRELMIMKGSSAAQLKPVHVTNNPIQEKFFLALEDKDIEL